MSQSGLVQSKRYKSNIWPPPNFRKQGTIFTKDSRGKISYALSPQYPQVQGADASCLSYMWLQKLLLRIFFLREICSFFSPDQQQWHLLHFESCPSWNPKESCSLDGFKHFWSCFPTSCGSRLPNQPWYASVNNKISSQVTRVGTNDSLAFLSSPAQLLAFKCHKK